MSIELYALITAIFKVGAVIMFIEPSASIKVIENYRALKPKAIIATPKALAYLKTFTKLLDFIPLKLSTGVKIFGAQSMRAPTTTQPISNSPTLLEGNHPSLITFTSGSSGIPKAIVRSHEFLIAQHQAILSTMQASSNDNARDLITLPIFLLSNLGAGITSVIPGGNLIKPAKINPKHIWQSIKQEKITKLSFPPIVLRNIADYAERRGISHLGAVEIYTGGGPIFPNLIKRLSKAFTNAKITLIYGSTEAEPIAKIEKGDISESHYLQMQQGKGLIAGKIVPGLKAKVVNFSCQPSSYLTLTEQEFATITAKPGVAGEIVVTGANVVKTYLNRKDNLETKFNVGEETWHRTGDAGYFDREDNLWLLGRCSQKFEHNNQVIYPFAVECAASSYEFVKQAAFVIVNGSPILAIELKASHRLPGLNELANKINAALGVDVIGKVIVTKIPMDKRHNSKVNYPKLQESLSKYLGK